MTPNDTVQRPADDRISLLRVFAVCIAVIFAFIAVDIAFFMGDGSFKREGGGLETASAFLYGVAVVVYLKLAPASVLRRFWHVPAMLTFFAMRELDMDKAFTPAGVLSAKLYSGDAALTTKLLSGVVAIFILAVAFRTVRFGIRPVLDALKGGWFWPWFVLATIALLVFTKSIDGLGRKLLEFGIVISKDVDATAALLEETGESLIPVFAIMAIFARWRGGTDERDTSGSSPAH